MQIDRHHFHFSHNNEIDSLYLTIGLYFFAESLIAIFVPIYFWGIGFPLWKILFFNLLVSLFFIASTFLFLPLMRKLSDKMMMFLGLPFLILYFLGLGVITEFTVLFYILPFLLALNILLFNVGYHMNFSSAADDKYIGREVGTRYMVGALSQFAAPFLGGLLIGVVGFQYTFIVGSALLLFSVVPLLFFSRRIFSPKLTQRSVLKFLQDKDIRPFNLSGIGYSLEVVVSRIVWPLFIFFSVGSIPEFGGVVSGGMLAAAIVTYGVGFLSDRGMRRKTLKVTSSLFALNWVSRSFLQNTAGIVGSHIGGNIVHAALMVSWSSQYYKIARAVPNPTSFILSREILYHSSRIVFLPLLMALAYSISQQWFFIVSFLSAGVFSLLFLFANKFYLKRS